MIKNRLVLKLVIDIFILDMQLRLKKFKSIVKSYCEKYENIEIKSYEVYTKEEQLRLVEELDNLVIAIQDASDLYPFNAKCLHRTLIGYKILRKKYQMPIKFVIGVKKFPFESHAWLKWNDEFAGTNVLDLEEDTNKYQIIVDSSTYKAG